MTTTNKAAQWQIPQEITAVLHSDLKRLQSINTTLLAALDDLADYAADCAAERDEFPPCINSARAAIALARGE